MNGREALDAISTLIPRIVIPDTRQFGGPMAGLRFYRNKRQCVVGYKWHRPGSHFIKGIVYDCILGYGPTYEDAIASARAKIERRTGNTR